MNITIVGGGNVGTQFAVHCSASGHKVTVYTSKPELFSLELSIVDETGNVSLSGEIYSATNSPQAAFSEAELILITVPPYMMEDVSRIVEQNAPWGVLIGLIPGTGGAECMFGNTLRKGAVLFGIQRVPSVARLVSYGKEVSCLGYRKELHIAAIPAQATSYCCDLVSKLFDINYSSRVNILTTLQTHRPSSSESSPGIAV